MSSIPTRMAMHCQRLNSNRIGRQNTTILCHITEYKTMFSTTIYSNGKERINTTALYTHDINIILLLKYEYVKSKENKPITILIPVSQVAY